MAGDPLDEDQDPYMVTYGRTVSASGTTRVYITGRSFGRTDVFVQEARNLLMESIRRIERELRKPIVLKYQPFEWFVPINLFKEKLTYRLTSCVLKIPIAFDRAVNKRKTYLKSLRNEA